MHRVILNTEFHYHVKKRTVYKTRLERV